MIMNEINIFNFVKSNVPFLEALDEFIELENDGKCLVGMCPFHYDNSKSLTVNPLKEIYYCFECHSGGDIIGFISKIEEISAMEAVNYLIAYFKLCVPKEIIDEMEQREKYIRSLNEPDRKNDNDGI